MFVACRIVSCSVLLYTAAALQFATWYVQLTAVVELDELSTTVRVESGSTAVVAHCLL